MRRLLPGLLLLSFAACQRPVPTSVFIDPALSIVIPSDAYALVGVRLEKLPDTPLYKKYLGNRPIELLDNFQKQTGIDARKDLYELLTSITDHGTLTLIKGKFADVVGRAPNIQFGGTQPTMYKSMMLLGTEESGIVFLNSSVAALGTQAQLRTLIDQRDRGPAPNVKTFLAKAEGIPHEAQIWSISLRSGNPFPLPIPKSGNMANLNRVFQSLQEFAGWADLRNGVQFTLRGTCPNDQEAQRLGDTLRGFVGLLRLSTPSTRPELLRVYDAVNVTQQQSRVDVKGNIPEDLLEAAVGNGVFPVPLAQ